MTLDTLPSNSDIVYVLAQYIDALEAFRSANIVKLGYEWVWKVEGTAIIPTDSPTRFERIDTVRGL